MTRVFGIAGVQMAVIPWDAEATVGKMAAVADQISQNFPWVNMIMFHELSISGVVQFMAASSLQPWSDVAQSIPGVLTDHLCGIAQRTGKWIIPGSMYEFAGGKIYNTAIAISPSGEIVARYRKMFPWLPYESETTPGNEFCVFDVTDIGRFGLCICYDSWFPEVARTLAWMGAEVILHPTITPT
jgi:formamidase